MNAQLMDQARAAYRAGDFVLAAQMFDAAKTPEEICGEADHLRGNCLMRQGLFPQAATAYAAALRDTAYGKAGALLTNQGKALAAAGNLDSAVEAFSAAVKDSSYATPYKAYMGLGGALVSRHDYAEAGTAFRQAAVDGTNPAPAAALLELGECFIQLGRPADAVETLRQTLDFAGPQDDVRKIHATLGRALAAAGKQADAVDAFGAATADGVYKLDSEEQDVYQGCQDSLSAQRAIASSPSGSLGVPVTQADPLDPMGQTGNFMPDPSDTGFFTLSESEMIQQDKVNQKVRRKRRHTGLKVFLVILLLLALAGGGLAFAFTRGLGYPSQQDTLTGLFSAVSDGTDTDEFLASSLDDSSRSLLVSTIPDGATATIAGMDQSMTESVATVDVALSKGGTQTYEVTFVREGIGWKVAALSVDFSDSDATATE